MNLWFYRDFRPRIYGKVMFSSRPSDLKAGSHLTELRSKICCLSVETKEQICCILSTFSSTERRTGRQADRQADRSFFSHWIEVRIKANETFEELAFDISL